MIFFKLTSEYYYLTTALLLVVIIIECFKKIGIFGKKTQIRDSTIQICI